jgi:hypothetical protein
MKQRIPTLDSFMNESTSFKLEDPDKLMWDVPFKKAASKFIVADPIYAC